MLIPCGLLVFLTFKSIRTADRPQRLFLSFPLFSDDNNNNRYIVFASSSINRTQTHNRNSVPKGYGAIVHLGSSPARAITPLIENCIKTVNFKSRRFCLLSRNRSRNNVLSETMPAIQPRIIPNKRKGPTTPNKHCSS